MGVLNITPDSFSDGGKYFDKSSAVKRAADLLEQGADVIDVGAQSTRPGAIEIGAEEEITRLLPIIKDIRILFPEAIISIDTFHSEVAKRLIFEGIDWINDISGGRRDPRILNVVAKANCPYVITHSRGNSLSMNDLTDYNDITSDVIEYLSTQSSIAINCGIKRENIIWDPGLGFAKKTVHNLALLSNLEYISKSNYPLLLGPSRKRFIGEITREEIANKRIFGTAAVICRCYQARVSIVRVHDVKEIKQTLLMASSLW